MTNYTVGVVYVLECHIPGNFWDPKETGKHQINPEEKRNHRRFTSHQQNQKD